MRCHAGNIARVRPADRVKNKHRVFDRTSHGPKFVEGPTQRHGAGARYTTIGGTQASHAAAHAGADDAAAGFATDRKRHQSRGSGSARASATAGRSLFEKPGVHRLAAEPDVVESQRAEA